MTCALSALRANKKLLKQNLSIFLDDPTMDWIIDSKPRQGGGDPEGGRSGGKGKGSAGNVSFLEDRMRVLHSKLEGVHPCDIMERELRSNTWKHIKENAKGCTAILDRARRSPDESAASQRGDASAGRGGAFNSGTADSKLLDVADQVFLL